MSPSVRLLLAPALLLAGGLLCEALPVRALRRAGAASCAVTVTAVLLLASVLGDVGAGGVIERSFPPLVHGVPLGVRGDAAGVILALSAALALVTSLPGTLTTPRVQAGLLLAAAGTGAACLASTLALLAGGLALAHLGALLLIEPRPSRAALSVTAVGALLLSSLGVLAAAVQLDATTGTSSFAAIPTDAVGPAVAVPWALGGALPLLAAAVLPAGGRTAAWTAVAALPGGLVCLLRLHQVAAALPAAVTATLGAVGVAGGLAGVAAALAAARHPRAAAPALLTALGAQAVIALAVGNPTAVTAAAVIVLGGVAASLALTVLEDLPGGRVAAVALVVAGGLPLGGLGVGLLVATGAEVAGGPPQALIGAAAAALAVLAVAAGAGAARSALAAGGAPRQATTAARQQRGRRALAAAAALGGRLDVAAGLAASLVLGLVPATAAGIAGHVSGSADAIASPDVVSLRSLGAGWAGGDLLAGAGIVALAVAAARALAGSHAAAASATPVPAAGGPPAWAIALADRVAPAAGGSAALAATWRSRARRLDAWLVGQPDLALIALWVGAALVYFQVRR